MPRFRVEDVDESAAYPVASAAEVSSSPSSKKQNFYQFERRTKKEATIPTVEPLTVKGDASLISTDGSSPTLSATRVSTGEATRTVVMRERLRKSAQQSIERTRGNVQLNKRLARRPTVVAEENITELDLEGVDGEIEQSIRMASKFVTTVDEKNDTVEGLYENNPMASRPEAIRRRHLDFKAPLQIDDQTETLVKNVDRRLLGGGDVVRIPEKQVPTRKSDIVGKDNERMHYRNAESFEDASNKIRRKNYVQMDVFVDSIHFDHHYLWSQEDLAVSHLRDVYFGQLLKFHQLAGLEEKEDPSRTSLINSLRSGHEELKEAAENLFRVRETQGFVTTNIIYKEKELDGEDLEDWMRMGTITGNGIAPTNSKVPRQEKERLNKLKKTFIRLTLFFNGIEVSKTPWAPVSPYIATFMRRFELELFSPVQSLSFIVSERQGLRERVIANVDIPTSNNTTGEDISALHEVEFVSTADMPKVGTSLGSVENCSISARLLCRAIQVQGKEAEFRALEHEKKKHSNRFQVFAPETRLTSATVHRITAKKKPSYRCAIDNQRMAAVAYAAIMRDRVMNRRQKRERKYEEVVLEQEIPSISAALTHIFSPADVSRKLKPMRTEAKQQPNHESMLLQIFVNVQSATNLPTRTAGNLQSFVEVWFQGKSLRTSVGSGRHPNWQFSGILTGESATPSVIEFRVYDEVVERIGDDSRIKNVIHEQLVHRLVAKAELCLSNLSRKGKIDCNLRLSLPSFHTSYSYSNDSSFLKLLLTIPAHNRSTFNMESFATSSLESPKTLSQCDAWQKELRERFPLRSYRSLVVDANAKSLLPTRFIRTIDPPSEVTRLGKWEGVRKAAEIVANIPGIDDAPEQHDIWTTVDQITTLAVCGLEERAVLLCCWLRSMQVQCAVLLGDTERAGSASVLAVLDETESVIDVENGFIYSTKDANCPMLAVYTAFDDRNVYANIQSSVHPSQIQFMFSRESQWKPLLPSNDLLQSVQPGSVLYTTVSEDWLVELRSLIEREVKLCFDDSRPQGIPQWNLAVSRQLREILTEVNDKRIVERSFIDEKMTRVRDSYNVLANAFRIPYRSIDTWMAFKKAEQHENCSKMLGNKLEGKAL
ncbi:unnamed protein product [Caenorhabditis auriculariae]|uniref:C2 domain-containing protein n=1 Tax=Caenorhabditis auriculariae TaxID=2777116 RepID=A0A8S1GS37_9PELO|nr:unnamed protein product [Caenorhabditis auriculariae]